MSKLLTKAAYFSRTFEPAEEEFSHVLQEVSLELNAATMKSLMVNSFIYTSALWSSPRRLLSERLFYLVDNCLVVKRTLATTATTSATTSGGADRMSVSNTGFDYAVVQKRGLDGGCDEYMERIVHVDDLDPTDLPLERPGR